MGRYLSTLYAAATHCITSVTRATLSEVGSIYAVNPVDRVCYIHMYALIMRAKLRK